MDGNGRWAKERGKPRTFGHKRGSKALQTLCKEAHKIGVEYITVYAFSTENWKRPKTEVDFLMTLLRQYLRNSIKNSKKDNIRVKIIGDRKDLDKDIINSIEELERRSQENTGLNLQIALNYGGRNEIVRVIKQIVTDYENKTINIDDIDESMISCYMDTRDIPNPDLMIRTSGEIRLSNFLLWQLAYSEFYFTNKHWPDYTINDLIDAIIYYNKKDRRFGGISNEN
jgi:undecaprenyl diphosphate synthase